MFYGEEELILPDEQNAFTFELNESLYFEKGQEVAEMLNISLDPEIAIESFADYISIRGVVELEGEYEKFISEDGETTDIEDAEDSPAYRYIERIEDSVEGRALFSHRFPVEISIPSYRVTDINDISVSIDYFDYEIPSENQLKLTSMIKIAGIRDQTSDQTKDSTEKKELEGESLEPDLLDERFEFDIKKENEKQEEELEEKPELIAESVLREEQAEHIETEEIVETEEPLTDEEKDRWKKYKETKTFEEFFKKPEEAQSEDAEIVENEHETPEMMEEYTEEETLEEMSEEAETMGEETNEQEMIGEDINYLSDMFRTDEDEQEFTQVRFCIVQEKDTIETIAERYKIPQSKIMKLNMLEDDDLEEGQLLSIPRKAEK